MKDGARKWGAELWNIGCIAIVAGLVWAAFALVGGTSSHDGNPNIPHTPAQIAKAKLAGAELAGYQRRKRYWIGEIEAGEASFAEASCELDLHGLWDEASRRCGHIKT